MLRTTGPVLLSSKNELLSRKHASSTEIDKDKSQDNHFQPGEMNDPSGIVKEILDRTIIIKKNRPKAQYDIIYDYSHCFWYKRTFGLKVTI